MGLASCAGSAWGIPYEGLRKLYQGMILPSLTFACSVWYTSLASEYIVKQRHILQVLNAIQKKAACIITGGFKNVSGMALDVEAHLLLVRQALEKNIAEAALRIQTCPNYELIRAIRDRPVGTKRPIAKRRKLRSPLQLLEKPLKALLKGQVEKRISFVASPWWNPPVTRLDSEGKNAVANHKHVIKTDALRLYTDGSDINGKIGAAVHSPQLGADIKKYLSSMEHYTVYSVELKGIDMACQLALDYQAPKVVIFTDNQAVIQASASLKGSSGQYILRRIYFKLTMLSDLRISVQLHWISTHKGVEGNEVVDKLAKEATGWRDKGKGTPVSPTGGPSLLSAAKQSIMAYPAMARMNATSLPPDSLKGNFVQRLHSRPCGLSDKVEKNTLVSQSIQGSIRRESRRQEQRIRRIEHRRRKKKGDHDLTASPRPLERQTKALKEVELSYNRPWNFLTATRREGFCR